MALLCFQPLSAFAGITAVGSPASQWTKFHYDLASTGFNSHETILSPSTVGNLGIKWTFAEGADVRVSPAIVEGIVYTADSDGDVYAIDASTGRPLWTRLTGPFPANITVEGGLAFVGSEGDTDRLDAFDAATGTSRWHANLLGGVGAPVVVGNTVYVGTNLGVLYALNASNGSRRWRTGFIGGVFNGLAVGGAFLYVPDAVGNCMRSYDRRTGALRWTSCLGGGAQIFGTPTLASGRIFVGARDGKLYALDAATGVILWAGSVGEDNEASPAAAYGLVYIGSYDGVIYAFPQDCTDPCSPVWTFQTGDQVIQASPAVANGVVYMGSTDGVLYALDALTGTELWSYPTKNWIDDAPAVLDGVVYVGSFDRHLYAFSLPSDT
jgi:outer membrane protein assembly factor BamB